MSQNNVIEDKLHSEVKVQTLPKMEIKINAKYPTKLILSEFIGVTFFKNLSTKKQQIHEVNIKMESKDTACE